MKLNIKGLAFVGFAAAIFAASAQADDKQIVTSKSYTEATYQKLANKLEQGNVDTNKLTLNGTDVDDTHYPTAKAVAQALSAANTSTDGKQAKSTANFQVGAEGGAWKQIVTDSYTALAVDNTDNTKVNLTVAVTDDGTLANAVNSTGANSADYNKLTTGHAVKAYADTKVAANAAITGATKTKITYDSKGLVTAGADLAASDIPDISATYQVVADRASAIVDDGTENDNSASTTKYTSNAAVTGWGQKKLSGTSGQLVTYGANAGEVGSATLGTATLTVEQNGVSAGTFGANATSNGTISIIAPDWSAASGTQGYIANKPAYDLPAVPSGTTCDATTPCALVLAGDAPTWVSMAQPGSN